MRVARSLAALMLLLSVLGSAFAHAEPRECVVRDRSFGVCLRYGGSSPAPGGGHENPDRGRRKTDAPECQFQGKPIACSNNLGTWVPHRQMWCSPAEPPPPPTHAVWQGRDGGVVHRCYRPKGTGVPDSEAVLLIWLPDAAGTPPPDPKQIAWELATAAGFDPITPGTTPKSLEQAPHALGAVGMPLWLWPEQPTKHQIGPVTASKSVAGYTISIVARVTSITWDLGDGSKPITCKTWKKPHPNTTLITTPVTCGRQTGYERQGIYTVTATTNWTVDWQGVGESGTIPLKTTAQATLKIGELQVLNTNPRTK